MMDTSRKVNGETFFVNTNNICFLCLHLKSGVNNDNESENFVLQPVNFPMRRICHFLRINLKEIFGSESLKGSIGDVSQLLDHISDFSVTLCSKCCPVARKLSDLVEELELIQMKVDDCLKSFSGLLEESGRDVGRVQQFQSVLTGPLEVTTREISELLREEMNRKCDKLLQSVLPKVVIKKGRINVNRNALLERKTISPVSTPWTSEEKSPVQNSSTAVIHNVPVFYEDPQPVPRKSSVPKKWKCNLCPYSCAAQLALAQHKRIAHPLKNASDASPGNLLRHHLLHSLKNPAAPMVKKRGDKRVPIICSICNSRMTRDVVKRHKIHQHVELLLASCRMENNPMENFKVYCEHLFHMELVSSTRGYTAEGNPSVQCPHCSNCYSAYKALRVHLFNEHRRIIASKLAELQQTMSVDYIRAMALPEMEPWKCLDCGDMVKGDGRLYAHKKHYCKYRQLNEGKGKLNESAKNLESQAQGTSADTMMEVPLELSTEDNKFICTLCNPHLTMGTMKGYKNHQIRAHMEIFLTSFKLPDVSMDDFKIYCDHVFQVELLSSTVQVNGEGNPSISCQNCNSKSYTNHYSLRLHIFSEHRDILTGKIVELQSNTTPQELRAIQLPAFTPLTKNKHQYLVTSSAPRQYQHTCDSCGTTFGQESSLYRHKSQSCKFRTRMELKCLDCDKVFDRSSSLYKHIQSEHPNHSRGDEQGVFDQTGNVTMMYSEMEGEDEIPFIQKVELMNTDNIEWMNADTEVEQEFQETHLHQQQYHFGEQNSIMNSQDFDSMIVPEGDPLD